MEPSFVDETGDSLSQRVARIECSVAAWPLMQQGGKVE